MATQSIEISNATPPPPPPGETSACPFTSLKAGLRDVTAGGVSVFAYGILAYLSFFVTILYAIGFVGNWFVPKTIDSGTVASLGPAIAINVGLMLAFAIQHTIMARQGFKTWITRFIPAAAERSTFVIAASALLGLLFWQWRPLPEVLWNVDHAVARGAIIGVSLFGWAMVFASSYLINHFDLFGLRQVFLNLLNRPYTQTGFRVIGFYKLVRHPLMTGFLIAFWATPTMTVGHLLFSVVITAYVLVGVKIEERDLHAYFGDRYRQYSRSVPALIPFTRRAH